jgi:hypothetical protein
MTRPRAKSAALASLLCFVTLSFLVVPCSSADYSVSYQLLESVNGTKQYGLNVIVPQSLQEYYAAKEHRMFLETDFAKFVTPYSLKPIAGSLGQLYHDDEDFANGALMIVHQIPYEATTPPKYPAETIVANKGDCDLFSYVAASVMLAGGLDVVLLYFEQEAHMNLGVSLAREPQDARYQVYYVTHNNVRYYMAECTGGNWQDGWRIGECPDELKQATPQVVTLEDCEQTATGQVSASYNTLTSSSLTLSASTTFAMQGSTVTLSGQLSPKLQNENITIYMRTNNSPWAVLDTVTTDSEGRYSTAWAVSASGMCSVRASWSGNGNYAATDSPVRSITSLSTFFVLLLAIVIILVIVGTVAYFLTRQTQPAVPEPLPPEIPS